jgi:hypothetical protein
VGCGAGQTAQVYVDGVEHTGVSLSGGWTPRLNRPAQATVTMPMEEDAGDCGSLLMITLDDDEIVFHGPILNTETDTNKDGGTTIYNAQDHMELWQHRPVRADDGDFSKPSGSGETDGRDIIATYETGPQILEAMLLNSIDTTAGGGGPPPSDAEGDIFLTPGSVAGGGAALYGAPVDWPMTIMDFFSLLVSTGQLDAVITYTNPGGGVTGTIDAYNGDYGTDLSASVRFVYGSSPRSAQAVRWNRDMTNMVNKYWIYSGPRIASVADPAGDQHWCFNITGDDPDLAYPPGGKLQPPAALANNQLGEKLADSRDAYGVRMKIDIFDAYDETCIPGFGTVGRDLYRYQWQVYSWFSSEPKNIVHVLPTDDTYIGCFGIGDLVGVEASSEVKGGFSGAQRVMEYTVSWVATPSLLTLSEIQTSSDAEGM